MYRTLHELDEVITLPFPRPKWMRCKSHDDVETGAFVMGDVVLITYKCKSCGKCKTVESVL